MPSGLAKMTTDGTEIEIGTGTGGTALATVGAVRGVQ